MQELRRLHGTTQLHVLGWRGVAVSLAARRKIAYFIFSLHSPSQPGANISGLVMDKCLCMLVLFLISDFAFTDLVMRSGALVKKYAIKCASNTRNCSSAFILKMQVIGRCT